MTLLEAFLLGALCSALIALMLMAAALRINRYYFQ
jgi:hypothetical protein